MQAYYIYISCLFLASPLGAMEQPKQATQNPPKVIRRTSDAHSGTSDDRSQNGAKRTKSDSERAPIEELAALDASTLQARLNFLVQNPAKFQALLVQSIRMSREDKVKADILKDESKALEDELAQLIQKRQEASVARNAVKQDWQLLRSDLEKTEAKVEQQIAELIKHREELRGLLKNSQVYGGKDRKNV